MRIKLKTAGLYGSRWQLAGSVLEVDDVLGKRRIPRHAVETSEALTDPDSVEVDEDSGDSQDAGELADYPGADDLAAVGITTIDGLRNLIDEHGDTWHSQVNGIGKSTAGKIVELLQA